MGDAISLFEDESDEGERQRRPFGREFLGGAVRVPECPEQDPKTAVPTILH